MLTEWKLENFKSVGSSPRIVLAPVTVLAGANSSGKTTLLQSILLIAQTLSSPNNTRPLILNAEDVKLGTWLDIPNCDTPNKPIRIECSITPPETSVRYTPGIRVTRRTSGLPQSNEIESITLIASFQGPKKKRLGAAAEPAIDRIELSAKVRGSLVSRAGKNELRMSVRRRKRSRPAAELEELRKLLPSGANYDMLNYIIEVDDGLPSLGPGQSSDESCVFR